MHNELNKWDSSCIQAVWYQKMNICEKDIRSRTEMESEYSVPGQEKIVHSYTECGTKEENYEVLSVECCTVYNRDMDGKDSRWVKNRSFRNVDKEKNGEDQMDG